MLSAGLSVFEECGRDSKLMFRTMYGLLGRGNILHMPKMDSIKEVVNCFSEFFYSKVQTIRDGLDRIAATSEYGAENLQTAPLKNQNAITI